MVQTLLIGLLLAALTTACSEALRAKCSLDDAAAEKASRAYWQGLTQGRWTREMLEENPGLSEMLTATSAAMLYRSGAGAPLPVASIPCLRPPAEGLQHVPAFR
jgi:hypothetical protein